MACIGQVHDALVVQPHTNGEKNMTKQALQSWVTNLRKKNMPVMGTVITELNNITGSDAADASQLADVILRDPNLTSHVLRVANSVQYNYSKQKINTISRAIVLIGLKGIRAICISLLILDRVLNGRSKERVLALVAQGFHAASQAQQIFGSDDSACAEEVFIAGLLFNLGEMAFWMSDDHSDDPNLLSENPKIRKKAIESIIGGQFKALTRELARHWQLGDTLCEALYPPKDPSPQVKSVILGDRISRAALYGWQSPQVKKVLAEVAEIKHISLDEALELVKSAADKANVVAVNYGASEACPMIPNSLKAGYFEDQGKHSKVLKPNAQVQLSVLRELSSTAKQLDVNTVFQMVLEGMHRGVGLERLALSLFEGRKVAAKYALGESTEHWRQSFKFDVGPYTDNIFTHAIEFNEPVWISRDKLKAQSDLYTDDIVRVIGRLPCFAAVLTIADRNAALIYADRGNFGGELNTEQFDSFKHFASQAQINLSLISQQRNRA